MCIGADSFRISKLFTPCILKRKFNLLCQLNALTLHDITLASVWNVQHDNAIFKEYIPVYMLMKHFKFLMYYRHYCLSLSLVANYIWYILNILCLNVLRLVHNFTMIHPIVYNIKITKDNNKHKTLMPYNLCYMLWSIRTIRHLFF